MAVSNEKLKAATLAIASLDGISINPNYLIEDVVFMGESFPDEDEFAAAVASTVKAMRDLVRGRVTPTPLADDLEGWFSYHYQHSAAQKAPADCRILFRLVEGGVLVRGFGHRWVPKNIYRRVMASRKIEESES